MVHYIRQWWWRRLHLHRYTTFVIWFKHYSLRTSIFNAYLKSFTFFSHNFSIWRWMMSGLKMIHYPRPIRMMINSNSHSKKMFRSTRTAVRLWTIQKLRTSNVLWMPSYSGHVEKENACQVMVMVLVKRHLVNFSAKHGGCSIIYHKTRNSHYFYWTQCFRLFKTHVIGRETAVSGHGRNAKETTSYWSPWL